MIGGHYILNKLGEPEVCHDVLVWARWFETADRHLAKTTIEGVDVSTVFLGLDHNFSGGRPLLWETLVFGGPLDGEMYRYESRMQAMRGHEEMCARLRQEAEEMKKVKGTRQIDLDEN